MATKAKEATYKSAYSTTINDLVNKAVNRQPFQYDPATDAAYQSYARQYTRLGDQAARDTLADVSAQTGGLPSSYAVTAAEQARSNYNQALTDKIPALMEAAYAKYRDEYNDTLAGINTLQGIDDSLYNRFATDRDFKENVRQFGLNYALDKAQFKEGKRQFNLNYKLDKDSAKFEKMLNTWTTLGYANKEVAKYFGIDKGTKTDDSAYRWAQMAMAQAKSGGGGGSRGGRGGGGGTTGDSLSEKNRQAYETALKEGNTKNAREYYGRLGRYLAQGGTTGDKQSLAIKKVQDDGTLNENEKIWILAQLSA